MAIPATLLENFKTLGRAFDNEDTALVEMVRKSTGKKVAVICAVSTNPENGEYYLAPFAVMINGDPFEMFEPVGVEITAEEEG